MSNESDELIRPIVEVKNVTKTFGGVVALNNVSVHLDCPEALGLVGDNGAGKSTLIKILSGVYSPDRGNLYVDGEVVHFHSPRDAWDYGIATVYQELALANKMNVIENIFLGHEIKKQVLGINLLNKRAMKERALELLSRLDVHLKSLYSPLGTLSGGERQAVAICRALNLEARVIILDEPTAALAVGETGKVLNFVKRIREQGKSVILISHNIEQVFSVVDRVVVLRHGRVVGEGRADEIDKDTVVRLITGTLETLEAAGSSVVIQRRYSKLKGVITEPIKPSQTH